MVFRRPGLTVIEHEDRQVGLGQPLAGEFDTGLFDGVFT